MFSNYAPDKRHLFRKYKELKTQHLENKWLNNKNEAKQLTRHFTEDDIRMKNKHIKRCSISLVIQSSPTVSDPMDYSLPGSFVHGIFQARVLEWGATAFSEKEAKEAGKYNAWNWF